MDGFGSRKFLFSDLKGPGCYKVSEEESIEQSEGFMKLIFNGIERFIESTPEV